MSYVFALDLILILKIPNPAKESPAIAAKFSPKLDLELIPLK